MSATAFLQRFQKIAEWSLLFIVVLAVLWRGGKGIEMTWIVAGAGCLLSLSGALEALLVPRSRKRIEMPMSLWALVLAYLLLTAVSYLASETRNYGLDEVVRDSGLLLIFCWIARQESVPSAELRHRFFNTLCVTSILVSVIGLAVYALQPVDRLVGTFFDYRFHTDYWPNAFADFALFTWPILLYGAMSARRRFQWPMVAALGLILGCLLLSFSRGAVIAFVGQVILLGAWVLWRRRRAIIALFPRIVSIIAIAVLTFAIGNSLRAARFQVQSVEEKVTFSAAEGTSSVDERAQFWKQALRLSFDRPLVGYGPYSFRFVQTPLMEGVFATSDHPHNVFLKIAVERGWLALIVFIGLIGTVLVSAVRRLLSMEKGTAPTSSALSMLLAVLGVLAHSLIDYNLQFVGIALPFWMALAWLVAPPKLLPPDSFGLWKLRRHLQRTEWIIALGILVTLLFEGQYLVTSSLGRRAQAQGDIQTALEWYELSEGQWFSRDMNLSRAQLLNKSGSGVALDVIRAARKINSHDVRLMKEEAAISSGYDGAKGAWVAALMLSDALKLGKYTDLEMLQLYLSSSLKAQAYYKEDLKLLEPRKLEFDQLFSEYADAIQRNTHFIALSEAPEQLVAVARLLGDIFPGDSERYTRIAREAKAHATKERERFRSRAPGVLW